MGDREVNEPTKMSAKVLKQKTMAKVDRKTVKAYLEDTLKDDDEEFGEEDVMALMTKLATERVDEGKEKAKEAAAKQFWQKMAAVGFIATICFLIASLGVMIFALSVMKESRSVDAAGGDYAEMSSHNGKKIRCASADIAVDENGNLQGLGTSSQIGTKPSTPGVSGVKAQKPDPSALRDDLNNLGLKDSDWVVKESVTIPCDSFRSLTSNTSLTFILEVGDEANDISVDQIEFIKDYSDKGGLTLRSVLYDGRKMLFVRKNQCVSGGESDVAAASLTHKFPKSDVNAMVADLADYGTTLPPALADTFDFSDHIDILLQKEADSEPGCGAARTALKYPEATVIGCCYIHFCDGVTNGQCDNPLPAMLCADKVKCVNGLLENSP